MNVSKRAWDMLSEGKSVDEVRIATASSKLCSRRCFVTSNAKRLKRRT